MEPDEIHPELLFAAYTPIDNSQLTELSLFVGATAANYSDQSETSFTFTMGDVTIEVDGSALTYEGGVPVAGAVGDLAVIVGGAVKYSFTMDGYPFAIFTETDPVVLAELLFSGSDVMSTTRGGNRLYGYDGDDLIGGAGGRDHLYGQHGDDQIFGGSGTGNDVIYGGPGDDWLGGGGGNDSLYGGKGSDTATFEEKFSAVVVTLHGAKMAKARIGFSETDKLYGIENVLGGLGKDKLTGDGNDNILGGFSGNDTLKGKGGSDLLIGGFGSDTLVGGKGSDVFLFDTIPAGHSFTDIDKVKDFQPGKDGLSFDQEVFSELDAGVLSADQFHAGKGAFAGTGEACIVYDTKSGALYYDPGGDADRHIYQVAKLKDAPHLKASDIFVIEHVDLDI